MVTYDEANKEIGEERKKGDAGEKFDARGTLREGVDAVDLRDREFGQLFEAFGDTVDVVREEREERRQEFDNSINISLEEELGIDFDELLDRVGEINDLDLSELDQQQLLAIIAEQVNNAVVHLIKLGNQNSGLAALLDDIAGSVQPPFGISVSGVNDINDPNVPQPVVRGSEGGSVNARVFKIKASENNTTSIWLGDEDVEVGTGVKLRPGGTLPINLDLRQDQLYMISEQDAQEIQIIGLV